MERPLDFIYFCMHERIRLLTKMKSGFVSLTMLCVRACLLAQYLFVSGRAQVK